MNTMNEIVLDGCRPVPLAHYLKALGILRLVSEQKDNRARGFWHRDRFILRTSLDSEELERFFLEEYRPTPIVGPWGARSGFYPGSSESSARAALTQLIDAESERFSVFKEAANTVRLILEQLQISKKEEVDGQKRQIMELCRAKLPDDAVYWLDACFSLLADDERFPPLLGSGGNEGSGSYMSGYMQQIAACLLRREHDACLRAALWERPSIGVTENQTPGHFIPNAGGANLSNGFGRKASIVPWDYILCLEGALVFTAAATRRMDLSVPSRTASFPFTVENSVAGYSTAVAEKNRGEMWFPTWRKPTSIGELAALFAEGRATVGRRKARDGVDFARAVASLGIDRGIDGFHRFSFQERNGQNNMAVSLGSFDVGLRPNVQLLGAMDGWLASFRWKSQGDNAPASAQRALRTLESSIFALCAHGDPLRVQEVLIALGHCERTMATSLRWAIESHLRPVPALDPKWLREADDGSVEYRLAAALASVVGWYGHSDGYISIRQQFEPVRTWKGAGDLRVEWEQEAGREVVWSSGHLTQGLNAVFSRRLLLAIQSGVATYPDMGSLPAALGDVADFIEGRVDKRHMTQLLHGLLLVDWTRVKAEHRPRQRPESRRPFPTAFYALLKLCFAGAEKHSRKDATDPPTASKEQEKERETFSPDRGVPVVPRIHRLAAGGESAPAAQEALRRLRGSGFVPALWDCAVDRDTATRSAAALLFPISHSDRQALRRRLLRPEQLESEPEDNDANERTMTSTQEAIA